MTLSDGGELGTGLLVWTAGVKANPIVSRFGLPLDDHGRVRVGPTLQVEGYAHVWALGDCASVPNAATPDQVDPPTSQHALRQARRLAANLIAAQEERPLQPYSFRSLGQVATLGRKEGIADLRGLRLRGLAGWLAARSVHLMQVPIASRRLGVVSDWPWPSCSRAISSVFPASWTPRASRASPFVRSWPRSGWRRTNWSRTPNLKALDMQPGRCLTLGS